MQNVCFLMTRLISFFDDIPVTLGLRRLIWGFTVCLCPKIRTPCSYGLSFLKLSDLLMGRSCKVIYRFEKICVISQFGRILVMIVLVPGHCLPLTLLKTNFFFKYVHVSTRHTHKQVQRDIIHPFCATCVCRTYNFLFF